MSKSLEPIHSEEIHAGRVADIESSSSSSRDDSIHRVSHEKPFSTHQDIVPDEDVPTANPGPIGEKDENDRSGQLQTQTNLLPTKQLLIVFSGLSVAMLCQSPASL